MQTERFDRIIIGAGLYGLYAALFCGRMKQKILVLEKDPEPFMRASYINQARVHQGYHYPRSLSTALKSAGFLKSEDNAVRAKYRMNPLTLAIPLIVAAAALLFFFLYLHGSFEIG